MTQEQATTSARSCDGLQKPGSVPLPVIGGSGGTSKKMRQSKAGRWRAISLIVVHLLIIAHVMHYLYAGRTVSPIEPSETMYALEKGEVNAGAIFFLLALLSTVVFGRFLCGWACHLVAYQDFCGWLMKKVGIRPQPFRSRLMLWIPFGVAVYMFIWPTFARLVFPRLVEQFPQLLEMFPVFLQPFSQIAPKLPEFSNSLMTSEFWETFPGPVFAVLTIVVCGLAAVYFLGAKGFCSYSCPYGGFFAPLDKLAVGKIMVTDACEHCGHCTANCTSNVRVHEEVKHYGMVVDPGCMKCMDCVSVCPNDALYFGFKAGTKNKLPRTERPRKQYDLSLGGEVVFLTIFLLAMASFRGIYDGPPFLMSLTLGAITAFLCFRFWALIRKPTVRIQNIKLKTAGAIGPSGFAFAGLALCWLVFTAHCGFIQYHRYMGQHYRNEHVRTSLQPSPDQHKLVEKSHNHFKVVEDWGLFDWVQVKVGLATYHYFHKDDAKAEAILEDAKKLAPEDAGILDNLVELKFNQRKFDEAIATVEELMKVREPIARDHFRIAEIHSAKAQSFVTPGQQPSVEVQQRLHDEWNKMIQAYEQGLTLDPDNAAANFVLGAKLGRMGRFQDAVRHLERAVRFQPEDVEAHIELAIAYYGAGRVEDAISTIMKADELAPNNPQILAYLRTFQQQGPR